MLFKKELDKDPGLDLYERSLVHLSSKPNGNMRVGPFVNETGHMHGKLCSNHLKDSILTPFRNYVVKLVFS